VLAQIAEGKNDHKTAAYNFKLSLEQAEDCCKFVLRKVGNISSQIMIDEIEGSYIQKDEKL